MTIEYVIFYILAFLAVFSALGVIISRNPIHSALFLIFLFFNTTLILLLFEVEFLGLIFLVVYVGAVTVLFLFVVMMLDLRRDATVKKTNNEKIFMFVTGLLFLIFLLGSVFSEFSFASEFTQLYAGYDVLYNAAFLVQDIDAISALLYGAYLYVFIMAGVVLLIAMIGAIHLTLNENILRIRQQYKNQIYKEPKKVVYLVNLRKIFRSLYRSE